MASASPKVALWLGTLIGAALVGTAIGGIVGYVAEALGAESIDYWMWGKWPFDPHAGDSGSFWWLVGGAVAGAAIGCTYRLLRRVASK